MPDVGDRGEPGALRAAVVHAWRWRARVRERSGRMPEVGEGRCTAETADRGR